MAWKLTSSALLSYKMCKYWFKTKGVIVHVILIWFPEQNNNSIEDPGRGQRLVGMHDCHFLVVFDIYEDFKFAKISFFEEGNITAPWTYMCCHFWTNMCGITSNFATMFSIDLFCCIRLYATVPLSLYCVQGVANIERSSNFHCDYLLSI